MIEPYYEEPSIKLYQEDCLNVMKEMPDESIDLILTDPPYGYSFMGKDWDKAIVRVEIWEECLRILKSGALAFVMSAPRQDVLSKMISNLSEAGFDMGFTSIYWAYASGFPKASNIGKMVDKQECKKQLIKKLGRTPTKEEFQKEWKGFAPIKEVKTDGTSPTGFQPSKGWHDHNMKQEYEVKEKVSKKAKELNGSYGGFQPKPAVEIIIVAMKPLSEKTYVDQALKNKKGISWLDDCRIPYKNEDKPSVGGRHNKIGRRIGAGDSEYGFQSLDTPQVNIQGRFPANLLVSDDMLNDGKITKVKADYNYKYNKTKCGGNTFKERGTYVPRNDSDSFSRYFDLDKWAQKTFPFLIVPKASKSEKNKGLENGTGSNTYNRKCLNCGKWERKQGLSDNYTCHCEKPNWEKAKGNYHPTVKPIKLMSYLITLGSRKDDIVLDPFVGSGTTLISCKLLNRKGIGIDNKQEYCDITIARLKATMENLL